MEGQKGKYPDHRSGVVPIVGRPNVGKSTLLNRLVGEKIAIVSPKPQTTWNRIVGVKTLPDAQVLFVDTPGIHEASSSFNRSMLRAVKGALEDADVILHMVDATRPGHPGDEEARNFLRPVDVPVILVVNKIDLQHEEGPWSEPGNSDGYRGVVLISALMGTGLDTLEYEILQLLPYGPQYYPGEVVSDVTERFIAREVIREKIFHLTHHEIPYACAVVVDEYAEREDGVVYVRASINVERDSQKGIVIGKGGHLLKEIGRRARMDLEDQLGVKVYLDLWVRVSRDWSKKDRALREFELS